MTLGTKPDENESQTSITSCASRKLASKSSKHSNLSANSRTSLKRLRKSSFTKVNEKINKGLKSTGGIKFKRNTGKANSLLSDFHQRKKVGVKSEEEKEAEKLELELAKKEAEIRNQEFIRKTQEAQAKRFDEQEARKKAKEEAIKNFDKLTFFEKLGLADEMVLEKIKKYLIIQILLLVISVLHCILYFEIIQRHESFANGQGTDGNGNYKKGSLLYRWTSFNIHRLVVQLHPTALFLVVFLVIIFKFYKFDTSEYRNVWIEQETRRIHDQSCS